MKQDRWFPIVCIFIVGCGMGSFFSNAVLALQDRRYVAASLDGVAFVVSLWACWCMLKAVGALEE